MNGILFRNSFLEQAEWVHLQKRENKRTVLQRAEPFRNAQKPFLLRAYNLILVPEQILRPQLLKL